MPFFERYLTLWVLICIAAGIAIGQFAGDLVEPIAAMEFHSVNLPVALLIWLMIIPMMIQIDLSALRNTRDHIKGLSLTVVVNWLIKPFSMALIAWLFFDLVYEGVMSEEAADQYIAGAILLGAAPCTAMVFVWSYLAKGDANYTLIQVGVNDLILLFAFIPIVKLLLGITSLSIPWDVLLTSTITFVLIPFAIGYALNRAITQQKGKEWLQQVFMPKLRPVSIAALLFTLILLFSFQGEKILSEPLTIVLIAIPLTIQTYLIYFVGWFGGRWLKLPYQICAPSSMIGASNFFELAVAVAIVLFGMGSGAALATVVGVLIEVPVMLSLVSLSRKWKF